MSTDGATPEVGADWDIRCWCKCVYKSLSEFFAFDHYFK